MAFECDSCHVNRTGESITIHMFNSYGPCEICKKVGACADCRCPTKTTVNETVKVEVELADGTCFRWSVELTQYGQDKLLDQIQDVCGNPDTTKL